MNVVYILSSTYSIGGATKSFVSMLEGMILKGVRPIVVVPDRNGIYETLQDMDVEVMVSCFKSNTYPRFKVFFKSLFLTVPKLIARRVVNWQTVRFLTKRLKDRHIDLIHTNVSVIDVGARVAKKLNVPHVYHIREYGDKDFHETYYPTSAVFHNKLKNDSYSICITKQIQEHHGLAGNVMSRVVYNGVDVPEVDLRKIKKEGYFLFAGRIDSSKGLLELLKAYSVYIKESRIKRELWVAGDVSDDYVYYNGIKNFISKNTLGEYVRLLGGRKDIFDLMQHADAIIIPSRSEGFGRCMTEAMMNGCLVIGHDVAGLKEQFDNGVGLVGEEIGLRYQSLSELTRYLMRLDDMDKEKVDHLTEQAYSVSKTLYSVTGNVEQVYQFYKYILNVSCH